MQAWVSGISDFIPSGLVCGQSSTPLTVAFEPGDYVATEGGSAYVQVRLSEVPSPERAVTIAVTARPGAGATAADYRVPPTVTIWPGDTGNGVEVTALPDGDADDGETVTLGFGALPGNVTVGTPATETVTLRDDPTSAETDRAALVALYNATGGASWTDNTNWLTDAPLGEWFGVETNEHGRVTGLVLGDWDEASQEHVGNGLNGMLPSALGTLAHLRDLRMRGNSGLTGPLPAELGDLANLDHLALADSGLTGPIPASLGRLTGLTRISLSGNRLTGGLPAELGELVNLKWLHLDNNLFTGEIPSALGNLSRLRALDLNCWQQHCRDREGLTGQIPPELGMLGNLERLSLHDNALTGRIPSELGNLSSLEELSLGNNLLTGRIPPALGNLAPLRELRLYCWSQRCRDNGGLTGPIPAELGMLVQSQAAGSGRERVDGADSGRAGESLQLEATEFQLQRVGGTDSVRARHARQSRGAGSGTERIERPDSVRPGHVRQSRAAGSGAERAERADPVRAREPDEPYLPRSLLQRADRPDSPRAGEPGPPRVAAPRADWADRPDPGVVGKPRPRSRVSAWGAMRSPARSRPPLAIWPTCNGWGSTTLG